VSTCAASAADDWCDRCTERMLRMRGIERGEYVRVGDVVVGHRQALALVERALPLKRDVRDVRARQERRRVRGDHLVVDGLDQVERTLGRVSPPALSVSMNGEPASCSAQAGQSANAAFDPGK
jgi:hypothetical protein